MKNRSVVLLISWSGVLLFSLWSLINLTRTARESYNEEILIRQKELAKFIVKNEKLDLNQPDQFSEMLYKLHGLEQADQIHFFGIKKDNQWLAFEEKSGLQENANLPYTIADGFSLIKNKRTDLSLAFYASYLQKDYNIVIGRYTNEEQYLRDVSQYYLKNEALQVLVLSGGLIAIAFFNLWGLMRTLNRVKSRGGISPMEVRKKALMSAEEQDLLTLINTNQVEKIEQRSQLETLSHFVASSIQRELSSGKVPPYTFPSTLVRFDINRLSTLRAQLAIPQRRELDLLIDQFFQECATLCLRYNGYAHEEIWDEMICYFKDEHGLHSSKLATQFLLDVERSLARYDEISRAKFSFPLTLKAALDYADLTVRFTHEGRSIKINGDAFFTTVRILPLVEDKTRNTRLLTESTAKNVETLGQVTLLRELHLRGVEGSQRIFQMENPLTMEDLLQKPWEEVADLVRYFRSDMDLVTYLRFLSQRYNALPNSTFLELTKGLYNFQLQSHNADLIEAYRWLLNVAKTYYEKERLTDDQKLPTVVALASRFFNSTVLTALEVELRDLTRLPGRIGANAVDIFTAFQKVLDVKGHISLFKMVPSNRKLANITYNRALNEISKGVIKDLELMLKAKDEKYVASSIWVIGEIYLFHSRDNRLYLEGHHKFQQLVAQVPKYLESDNLSIRNQAQKTWNVIEKVRGLRHQAA